MNKFSKEPPVARDLGHEPAQSRSELIEEIKSIFDHISTFDVGKILKMDWGMGGFSELGRTLSHLQNLCSRAQDVQLTVLPMIMLRGLERAVRDIDVALEHLWQLRAPPPDIERQRLVENVENAFQQMLVAMAPAMSLYPFMRVEPDAAMESAIAHQVTRLNEKSREFEQELSTRLAEAKQLTRDLAEMAKSAGVTREATHFSKLSEQFRIASRGWLASIIVVSVLLLWFASWLVTHDALAPYVQPGVLLVEDAPEVDGKMSIAIVLQHVASRVIVLTIGFTVLVFCIRNYNAAQHNRIVNEHRAVSLSTFQTFHSGARGDQLKDAVLTEATRAAFSFQATGYLGTTDAPQITQVTTELGKLVTGKESSNA